MIVRYWMLCQIGKPVEPRPLSESVRVQFKFDCAAAALRAAIFVVSSVGAALFSTAGLAANVDYEGETLGSVTPSTPLEFEGPIYITALGTSEIEDGAACAPNCPHNDTIYQLSHGAGFAGALTIGADPDAGSCSPNCNSFHLFKLDVAEPNTSTGSLSLIIQPIPADGSGADLFFFDTDGVVDGAGGQPDFETIVFPSTFRDLEAVVIVSAPPYMGVAIDNLIVEPQPTPTLTPLGLGALALALCGRDQAKIATLRHTRNNLPSPTWSAPETRDGHHEYGTLAHRSRRTGLHRV